MRLFQTWVRNWVVDCFGKEVADNKEERNHRFLEEALELFQSLGGTQQEANLLVEYVFNRPLGEPSQEVGGVATTLAALCSANELDLSGCAFKELARITSPEMIDKIRRKQATKPASSPLPGSSDAE